MQWLKPYFWWYFPVKYIFLLFQYSVFLMFQIMGLSCICQLLNHLAGFPSCCFPVTRIQWYNQNPCQNSMIQPKSLPESLCLTSNDSCTASWGALQISAMCVAPFLPHPNWICSSVTAAVHGKGKDGWTPSGYFCKKKVFLAK